MTVPEERVRRLAGGEPNPEGAYVLYWMTASRRLRWNHALERASGWARELGRPLVVLEALRAGYRWASDRHHRWVLDGMADHARALTGGPAHYYPYVEPEPGAGRGLLVALGRDACLVVTDDSPAFFFPRMLRAATARLSARLEAVDSCGLFPVRAVGRAYGAAYPFRRLLQRELPARLRELPEEEPLAAGLPSFSNREAARVDGRSAEGTPTALAEIARRWPPASPGLLAGDPAEMAQLPVDHAVPPVGDQGGPVSGEAALRRFLEERLPRYAAEAAEPAAGATSELSPWLHFGHLSAQQVFAAVAEREGWSPERLGEATGKRTGWWGLSAPAEAFLEQLVTWRELGFNAAAFLDRYDGWGSLPEWARRTLETHADDPRPDLYPREALAEARTDDPVWNAAQTQLRREGRIHNSLRMLWGKRVLEWTPGPREALEVALELNDRWAVDGRDPNSVSGVFWCLGRYDRPWGPERPIFGKVRYMTSRSARRKYRLEPYLRRYAPEA